MQAAAARTTLWRSLARPIDDVAPPARAAVVVAAAVGAVSGLAGWVLAQVAPVSIAVVVTAALWCALALALPERSLASQLVRPEPSSANIGQLVLTFAVLLRVAAVSTVSVGMWVAALAVASAIGRLQAVFLQFVADPVDDDRSTTEDYFTQSIGLTEIVIITATICVAGAFAFGWRIVLAVALSLALTFVIGLLQQRRSDRVAVEVLGVVVWLGELITLFALIR
jgi:cobalamin synthase